jgi:hypothetical protein
MLQKSRLRPEAPHASELGSGSGGRSFEQLRAIVRVDQNPHFLPASARRAFRILGRPLLEEIRVIDAVQDLDDPGKRMGAALLGRAADRHEASAVSEKQL